VQRRDAHDNDELDVTMCSFDLGALEATCSFNTVTFPARLSGAVGCMDAEADVRMMHYLFCCSPPSGSLTS